MKKFIAFLVLVFVGKFLLAQVEELDNLSFNPSLYYPTKQYQPQHYNQRYLIDNGNIVVTTDTLQLPFVDDFSTNRLRSYKWVENHITDTFYNVFGTCLGVERIKTINETFSLDTAWYYDLDTIGSYIFFDSVPQPSIPFTFFGPSPSNCFSSTPQTFYYWHQYYSYSYDTSTHKIDSTFITADSTIVDYAPVVYFATGETGTLWFDNYAYHNYTYPIDPPTLGVATLDGLNQFGLPYNNTNNTTYGDADYLTSKPINLQGITDTSVFLSFFYEPQGLGDYPDEEDSLIVEFKEVGGVWDMVWATGGFASVASADTFNKQFKQVLIQVPQLPLQYSYYHNQFQFRFRNKASLYGNNDHWHIDYVRLDKTRFATDTNIQDIAFVYPFPTVLKNFTLMPADQFNNPADLRDTILLTVHNLDRDANNNPPATNFVKKADELYPSPVIIAPSVLQAFNAGEFSSIQVNPSGEYAVPAFATDSLVLLSSVSINPNDSRPQNDTAYHVQDFNSVMAYDDGSAERSYGISGLGVKKFAYEFNLNHPDTLAAFQIQFSQVDQNVSNLVFNFNAWDSLKMNDLNFEDDSTLIFSMENRRPTYIDSVNGFATYKLDSPILVSGKIYFGWTQTDTRRLQIGYDLNSTLGRQHMYIFTNTTWKASTITPLGSPMIRLIFDSAFWGGNSTAIEPVKDDNKVSFFPNPTTGMVYVRSERNNVLFEISVTNVMGQRVMYENAVTGELNMSALQNGVYLISAKDTVTGKTYHSKIIKTTF